MTAQEAHDRQVKAQDMVDRIGRLADVYDVKLFITEISAYLVVRKADGAPFLLRQTGGAPFARTRWQRSPIATKGGRTVDAAVAELLKGERVWKVLDVTCIHFVDVDKAESPQDPRGTDMVNRPNHYAPNGVDSFMHMKDQMGKEAFDGFLQGNAIKYVQRYKFKGKPVEDLTKAAFYLFHLAFEAAGDDPATLANLRGHLATTLEHAGRHYGFSPSGEVLS